MQRAFDHQDNMCVCSGRVGAVHIYLPDEYAGLAVSAPQMLWSHLSPPLVQ